MDRKNENSPSLFEIENVFNSEDTKVTSIENHIKKRQHLSKNSELNTPTPTPVHSDKTIKSDQVSPNSGDASISYLATSEIQSGNACHTGVPASIFSDAREAPGEDLSDLEQRILQRIQNELDHSENHLSQNMMPHTENILQSSIALLQASEPEKPPEKPLDTIKEPPAATLPVEVPKEAEQVDINMLERWLDKSPKQETGYSHWIVSWMCLASLCIGIILGGISVFIFMKPQDQEKMQIEEAYQAYRLMMSSRSSHATGGENNTSSSLEESDMGDHNYSGSATIAFAVPVMETKTVCNENPVVKLTPLSGGKTSISIDGKCRHNQTVQIEYAGLKLDKKLDENGQLALTLDCFAGDKSPINFQFEDKHKIVRKPVALDLDKVTKVAVIWKGSANLNLHAFEYMAGAGQEGHVWENNPSSFRKAMYKTKQTGRGHGFISSAQTYGSEEQKVEVYTFLNTKRQQDGVVKLALDYQLKGNNLHHVTCQSQGDITIDYTTIVLTQNNTIKTSRAASILNPCNLVSTDRKMLNTRAVEDLVFGR